ncbi:unnamed protein product [Callosobruchus maculatus]|uniref:ABC transporter domain-containing protein n=1 Tax=Callosobruchus maculatus TaxID=64391 RepID=A0A653CD72_CALMS|nr:unnamed protein product [Callosobruchus maculatus]
MIIMLVLDTFIYLIVAVYIEAVFPGIYGVPLPWYFPVTASYWCGRTAKETDISASAPIDSGFFEKEPSNLKVGVQIKNLKKVYGTKAAVQSLSLNMYENQITVLLGHNGAGKTTTLLMLTGMITPTSGTAIVNGYDIRRDMASVRKSMGICPQHDIIFEDLTVTEHIYFYSRLKGLTKSQTKIETTKYIAMMELQDKRNSKASKLSGGMKRKLCLCIALCGNSKVVMLDEPTSGMDPSARRALWDLLLKQKEGRTILLTTQFMDEADILGDRIAIMSEGELKCCGSSFFLKKKYGTGYLLIIDKGPECDSNKVTALLKGYIPDIEVRSNTESELSYLLPENRVSVFEAMLKQLESQSRKLNVHSYGISLTTLEEVFIRAGAQHSQEVGRHHALSSEVDNLPKPTYTSGMRLIASQCLAMYLKRYISMKRSWVLWLIHFVLPTIFVLLIMLPSWLIGITDLPPMPLTLSEYEAPITLIEKGDDMGGNYQSYKRSLLQEGYRVEHGSIVEKMLRLVTNIAKGDSKGEQIALYTTFAFVFTSCFYIMFIVRENTCKSKHLQFVAGTKIPIFWLVTFVFDFITYILVCLLTLTTLACFQEDGFKTAEDLSRFLVILICFGWAFFPMIYIAAYFFKIPANGFVWMCAVCFCADNQNTEDGRPESETCDRSSALRHVTGTTLFFSIGTERVIYNLLFPKTV